MTGPKIESAVWLFVTFGKLLKLCDALRNFDYQSAFALRRIDRSLSQQLSDCAAS